jgi:outer membrane protein OmpA-like peptidoglycan-associated protein
MISLQRMHGFRPLSFLMEKYYVKAERVTAEGHGEANPVASNDTAGG